MIPLSSTYLRTSVSFLIDNFPLSSGLFLLTYKYLPSKHNKNKTIINLLDSISQDSHYSISLPLYQHSLKYFSFLHILHYHRLSRPLYLDFCLCQSSEALTEVFRVALVTSVLPNPMASSQFTHFLTHLEHLVQLSLSLKHLIHLAFSICFSSICLPTSWGPCSVFFEGSLECP